MRKFIRKLRAERKYEKIGAVGYCYGGALGIRLGAAHVLDSLVICHPTIHSADGIRDIRVPTAFVCAEGALFVAFVRIYSSDIRLLGSRHVVHARAASP